MGEVGEQIAGCLLKCMNSEPRVAERSYYKKLLETEGQRDEYQIRRELPVFSSGLAIRSAPAFAIGIG